MQNDVFSEHQINRKGAKNARVAKILNVNPVTNSRIFCFLS